MQNHAEDYTRMSACGDARVSKAHCGNCQHAWSGGHIVWSRPLSLDVSNSIALQDRKEIKLSPIFPHLPGMVHPWLLVFHCVLPGPQQSRFAESKCFLDRYCTSAILLAWSASHLSVCQERFDRTTVRLLRFNPAKRTNLQL